MLTGCGGRAQQRFEDSERRVSDNELVVFHNQVQLVYVSAFVLFELGLLRRLCQDERVWTSEPPYLRLFIEENCYLVPISEQDYYELNGSEDRVLLVNSDVVFVLDVARIHGILTVLGHREQRAPFRVRVVQFREITSVHRRLVLDKCLKASVLLR